MRPTSSDISYVFVDGKTERRGKLTPTPFVIGRSPAANLTIAHPAISRTHATVIHSGGLYRLIDEGSRHGCYLNGERVTDHEIHAGDVVHFGREDGPRIQFESAHDSASTILDLTSQFAKKAHTGTDLTKLDWLIEAARRLNADTGLEQILDSLIETTLELTGEERGFVFLADKDGTLRLAAGQTAQGAALTRDVMISWTAVKSATQTAAPYIVTDTLSAEGAPLSDSIVREHIRSIVCIPLRKRVPGVDGVREILGVLYLDSQLQADRLTSIYARLLQTIAAEAAALVENATLAQSEEAARRYREELEIAARIQQGIMAVLLPELDYAKVCARSLPCKEVGGDFYDFVAGPNELYAIIADVSGKGVSAALLAATLQGLFYTQLLAGHGLTQIASLANQYICARDISKYATLVLVRLSRDGEVEYLNCGHVPPLLVTTNGVTRLENANLPIGLFESTEYKTATLRLRSDDRLVLVTDGVTEAEDCVGEFFGDARLEKSCLDCAHLDALLDSVNEFAQGTPPNDDCTLVELRYLGNGRMF
jgi:sigma-B regulation protein RsbU (phosphoserine phosphatase)